MFKTANELVAYVRAHRCYSHPIFHNWVATNPDTEVVGALFHQINCFCASTRPGWNFPTAVKDLGLFEESDLLQEIVESEEDHGSLLLTMVAYILNRSAKFDLCPDIHDGAAIEKKLKAYSDKILGSLPGYDPESGLTAQTQRAMAVFDRRKNVDRNSVFRNLGTALALEIISNRQLIPGEKHCLIDSRLYGAEMTDPEMHYLVEHWGEIGAEQQHEKNAIAAVASVLNEDTKDLIFEGVEDFLESLLKMWDLLDCALLESGYRPQPVAAYSATENSAV